MRKIVYLFALLIFSAIPANAQGVREGDERPVISGQTQGGPLFSVPFAQIDFCGSPNVGVPCVNKVTTYTDITLTTPCQTSTQIVLAGTNSCIGTTDGFGNWGVWVPAGTYTYTIQLPSGASLGPYTVTLSTGGAGGSGIVSPATLGQVGGYLTTGSTISGLPNILFNGGILTLGSSGILGGVVFGNTASGTLSLNPATGPLGNFTLLLPNSTNGTLVEDNLSSFPQFSFPFWNGLHLLGLSPAPTTNCNWLWASNVTANVAVQPTAECPGILPRAISGATNTDLVSSADNIQKIVHYFAATQPVTETLPTPTTLGIPDFAYSYCNDSPQTDTIAPTSWTIQAGSNAATSTLSVASGACYRITIDPAGGNWLADSSGIGGGTVSNPNGPFVKGNPTFAANNTTGIASSNDSIDCVVGYGVVGNAVAADNAALQACFSAAIAAKTTAYLPGGLNILLTSAAGGLPINFLNAGTQGALRVVCGGQTNYGQASTWFQTADAVLLFQIGKIANGSASQFGSTFENCGFQDVSAGHNTAIGAIYVTDTNASGCNRCTFANFGRPTIAAPSAPAIAGSGAGATSFWVEVACVTDSGATVASGETTLASNSNPLTITAPTCAAPSTGWVALATTSATGAEVLQASAGYAALNSSGSGGALGSNWVGTVNNSGGLNLKAFKYDRSGGYGIHVDAQSGAAGTAQDASYGSWTDNYFLTGMQEDYIFDGGIQNIRGGHCSGPVVYCLLMNNYQAGQAFAEGLEIEIANTTTARGVIVNSQSSSRVNAKFEGTTNANTNITCAEVNTPRNYIGGTWTKCGVALIQENAGGGDNNFDVKFQVNNNACPLITGLTVNDSANADVANCGPGFQATFNKVTVAGPTGALATTGSCATATGTITGLTTSGLLSWNFAAAPPANYGNLTVTVYPTSNTANVVVCNPTAGSITPSATNIIVTAMHF